MPLPNGPGEIVSWDYFGLLLVTERGNEYILLFTDSFSRHASMHEVSEINFKAAGTANVLAQKYIPEWGCPKTSLSDNGLNPGVTSSPQ